MICKLEERGGPRKVITALGGDNSRCLRNSEGHPRQRTKKIIFSKSNTADKNNVVSRLAT